MVDMPEGIVEIPLVIQKCSKPSYICSIAQIDEIRVDSTVWYYDVWNLLKKGEYPAGADKKDRITLRKLAAQFIICGDQLYKRNFDGTHLTCLSENQTEVVMEKIHGGECGPHMSGHMLAKKIIRQGYYWSTMQHDCSLYVRRCLKCQKFSHLQHLPPRELYNLHHHGLSLHGALTSLARLLRRHPQAMSSYWLP